MRFLLVASSLQPPAPSHVIEGVQPVTAIRAAFPSIGRTHNGQLVAYLDGPGGTQVPQVVADAMSDYLIHHNANTHWNYPTSAETDAMLWTARQTLADFLGGAPDEIAFGANMTTLTFHLGRALGRTWGSGDTIVVTELDHHGNVAPWQALAKERGVTIRTVRMNPADGTLDWEDLQQALHEGSVRLLAIGGASNALGTINDIRAATTLAHEVGALAFVDAVHYAPHVLTDVKAIGCDFLACSAYKFYGPHIGILWGRHALLESLDLPKLDPAPNEAPENLETGTQNHEGIVGAAAAVEWLASLAGDGGDDSRRVRLGATMSVLHERSQALFARLHSGLGQIAGVTRYGPPPGAPRTATISFTIQGRMCDDVAGEMASRGLFMSHGDFYATTVIERLKVGPDGVLRVGCACYTTQEEIDRVLSAVAELASEVSNDVASRHVTRA